MPAQRHRGALMTGFAVVGCFWFGLHAIEYLAARYVPLQDILPLPASYGLAGLLDVVPGWASIAIGAAVWLGLLGSILLLLRDKASVLVLALGFLASLVALAWGLMALADGLTTLGGVNVVQFTAALAAVALGCWLYARVAKRAGSF